MPLQARPDDSCWETYEARVNAAYAAHTDAVASAALTFLSTFNACATGSGGDSCRAAAVATFQAASAAADATLTAELNAAIAAFLACEGVTANP